MRVYLWSSLVVHHLRCPSGVHSELGKSRGNTARFGLRGRRKPPLDTCGEDTLLYRPQRARYCRNLPTACVCKLVGYQAAGNILEICVLDRFGLWLFLRRLLGLVHDSLLTSKRAAFRIATQGQSGAGKMAKTRFMLTCSTTARNRASRNGNGERTACTPPPTRSMISAIRFRNLGSSLFQ